MGTNGERLDHVPVRGVDGRAVSVIAVSESPETGCDRRMESSAQHKMCWHGCQCQRNTDMKKDSNAGSGCQTLVRHICGHCGPGYLRFASPDNPAKTDWCAMCQHRAEGINREVEKAGWQGFKILHNANVDASADEKTQPKKSNV
jgi:hypothetical protein